MSTERNTHDLKILNRYFEVQISGRKTFEFRKDNGRFYVGDLIRLHEVESTGIKLPEKTGRSCLVEITYILPSNNFNGLFEGIEEGYSVLSTRLISVEL